MYRPVTQLGKELLARLSVTDIEADMNARFNAGTPHHPKAKELAHVIGELDWMFGGDCFGFKFGGDGDNGESLTYLLDVWFELLDKESEKGGDATK